MSRLPEKLLLLALLMALAVGCKPKIGDDCQLSPDCSAAGDRLCDITAPGGYCTVYNCEPGSCPEDESLCVEFGAERSPVSTCSDAQSPSPYARTFCMATCESDDDCRDGYQCASLSGTNDWNAILIDKDRGAKACLVPVSSPAFVDDPERGGVCQSAAPGSSPTPSGGTSAGGASGSAGESGAAGMSEAGAGGAARGEGGAAGLAGVAGAADGGAGG